MIFNSKAQTTIELLLILSISLIALIIVYSIYSEQILFANDSKETFLAKNSVQNIINAANTVYLSGSGSEIKIEVEIPGSVDLNDSLIVGKTIIMSLANGSDIIGVADVNISGEFRQVGKNIIYLISNGQEVLLRYKDFEVNKQNVSFSSLPNKQFNETITIRNNLQEELSFSVLKNFFHNDISLDMNVNDFILKVGEIKTIDLNFIISDNAKGNYSGNLIFLNSYNGFDTNKKVSISIEVLPNLSDLIIYPLITTINKTSSSSPQTETKSFSICNTTSSEITNVSWSKDGNVDANLANWFSIPLINSVKGNDCNNFDILFTIPENSTGHYDGNLSAIYNDTNIYSIQINAEIS